MKGDFKKARSLIFQILTLLALFTTAFILLRRANLIKFPGFIEKFLHTEQEITSDYSGDGQEIFKYIGKAGNTNQLSFYPEITIDNMNALLNSLEPHKNFYWESVSETYYSDSATSKKCRSRISGDKYNVEILDKDEKTVRKYVSDGKNTAVSKPPYGESDSTVYMKGIFDFYSDASLISVDFFKDAEFSDDSCEIRLVENQQYNIVSVVHTYDRNGVTVKNNYGISLDYGVVLFAECFENNIPVFRQSTLSIYPLTSLDDNLFIIN